MTSNTEMTDDQIEDMTILAIELHTRMRQSLPVPIPTVPMMAALTRLVADMHISMVEKAKCMNMYIPSTEELIAKFSKDLLEMTMNCDQIIPND